MLIFEIFQGLSTTAVFHKRVVPTRNALFFSTFYAMILRTRVTFESGSDEYAENIMHLSHYFTTEEEQVYLSIFTMVVIIFRSTCLFVLSFYFFFVANSA